MRIRITIIAVFFSMLVFSGCESWTFENPNPDCEILSAMMTPEQIEAESTSDIIITAKVKSPELFQKKDKYVIQIANNDSVYEMFDDGLHNDEEANDGIYGTVITDWQAPETPGIQDFNVLTVLKKRKDVTMFLKTLPLEVLEKKVPPVIENFEAIPSEIEIIIKHNLKFTAKISDENGLDDIESVTLDLTNIGGKAIHKMVVDPEAGEGFYTFLIKNFNAPDEVKKMEISITATDKAGLSTTLKGEISTYPTPNRPPEFAKIMIQPRKIYFDSKMNLIISVHVVDLDGNDDVKSVTVDMSSLGFDANQKMFDDGKHYDNVAKDGVYGYFVSDYTPVRETKKYEVKFKAIDSEGVITEATEIIEVVDPSDIDNESNPTLHESEDEAPDEVLEKFRNLFDNLKSAIYLKDEGEGEKKKPSLKIIITEENSWDPEISGYTGFCEGGLKFVHPVSWTLKRNHDMEKSRWQLDFDSGFIRIEMLPYKAGEESTLDDMAKKYHEELKTKYQKEEEEGEILNLNFDDRFKKYNKFLDQDSIWFDFYLVSKDSETITHTVYMFYAKEASSSKDDPVYRTFKVEYVRIPIKIKTNAFDNFVKNFSVN